MGWLRRAAKAVWRVAKGAARVAIRIFTFAWGIAVGLPDLILGFLLPTKKLRLQVFILSDKNGTPLTTVKDVQPSIDYAKDVFKRRFNVELKRYGSAWTEVIEGPAPPNALSVHCGPRGFLEEYGEAGEYFNDHLAGWNGTPVSGTFPITVFIVDEIKDKVGCSMGPLTDYVTVEAGALAGAKPSTMAHELGHACNLLHTWFSKSNLMWPERSERGDTVHWWQKNLFRSSRHVLWW